MIRRRGWSGTPGEYPYGGTGPTVTRMRRTVPVLIPAIALFAGLALGASACSSEPEAIDTGLDPLASQRITTIDLGTYVGDVALPDASNDGEPFAMRADDGELLIAYFGFTACPDICPTTLSDLRAALEAVGGEASRVDVAMTTIDPDRDSDSNMVAYLGAFVEGGHPLRTDDQATLRAATDAFGADYDVFTGADGRIQVIHTAYLYGIDDAGTIQIIWPFGSEPERIASDIVEFLDA